MTNILLITEIWLWLGVKITCENILEKAIYKSHGMLHKNHMHMHAYAYGFYMLVSHKTVQHKATHAYIYDSYVTIAMYM